MRQLVITVNNKENTEFLLSLLNKFTFVNSIKEKDMEIPKSKFNSIDDMKKCFGIWKGRNITKERLREKAWRIR